MREDFVKIDDQALQSALARFCEALQESKMIVVKMHIPFVHVPNTQADPKFCMAGVGVDDHSPIFLNYILADTQSRNAMQ